MTRSAMLFAVAAIALLIFALLSRYMAPAGFVTFTFHRESFAFSPDSVCVFMAAFLCVFAAIYSFWILPMNQKAATWHFWLTAGGILIFWIGFYSLAALATRGRLVEFRGAALATAVGLLTSSSMILIAQGIFLANLISGIAKLRHGS